VLAVGEQLWDEVDPQLLRASSGLAGGLGCGHQELCGALSGGSLIIGVLYGRTSPQEDDTESNWLVRDYRDRFLQKFGTTCCEELRDSGYGSEGQWPCSVLVERATRLLWQVLAGGTQPVPSKEETSRGSRD
jgi:C_GCAxxG_C_C family probable redox protein